MKTMLTGAALCAAFIVAAQAQGEDTPEERPPASQAETHLDWSGWTRPPATVKTSTAAQVVPEPEPADDVDVVDAHWMALTMWGEARSQGEDGMRAVGHVIHNRWRAGRGEGHVTGTVSEAWQFSCWNEGDPNRAAMLNVEALSKESGDYRLWRAAKRLAEEILAGRSVDPTSGALFYHTTAVQPKWSEGVAPVARIGEHLFFRAAR